MVFVGNIKRGRVDKLLDISIAKIISYVGWKDQGRQPSC
jgi:hypothetical protein